MSIEKNFDPLEQCPICEQQHVLKLSKNNLKKTWEPKFKLAWMRRSECGHGHIYMWPISSDKNLSGTHSRIYCSKELYANAKLRAISQLKKLQQLTRDPRVETFGGAEARMCPRSFLNYFDKLSQKLTCLSPDKDVLVGFITGRSRQKLTLIRVVEVSDYLVPKNKIDL